MYPSREILSLNVVYTQFSQRRNPRIRTINDVYNNLHRLNMKTANRGKQFIMSSVIPSSQHLLINYSICFACCRSRGRGGGRGGGPRPIWLEKEIIEPLNPLLSSFGINEKLRNAASIQSSHLFSSNADPDASKIVLYFLFFLLFFFSQLIGHL